MPRREPVVRFERFTCRYAADLPPILDGLDLEIEKGEYVFILGASGVGKTTLGLAINGVIPHILGLCEGAVYVLGKRTDQMAVPEIATHVGMVFQDVDSQLSTLRVRDEVAFGPENLCLPKGEVLRRVNAALTFVGLQHLANRSIFELSGGEKQKVALAAVLAMEPEILFLDEPAANLDPKTSSEIVGIIRQLKGQKTILVFENKVDEFLPEADRLIVLDKGRVACDGTPRAILARHGRWLLDQLGVWIPQPSELMLQITSADEPVPESVPLTVEEAVSELDRSDAADAQADVAFPASQGASPRSNGMETPPLAERRVVADVHSVFFRYDNDLTALEDVSLTIAEGEWLAIVGPNGSGKTTLAKHLMGLLKPRRGTVEMLGMDTRSRSIREIARMVGYVFQNPEHQFVRDTVAEELLFSLRAAGTPEPRLAERVHDSLTHFDLLGLEARHPYSLSGGEKRRLSVATVLITNPRLLILDEPTFGLDRRNTQQLMGSIAESAGIRADGHAATVVMLTHDMRLVAEYATTVGVMSGGRLIYHGLVAELFASEELLDKANLEYPPLVRIERLLRSRGKTLKVALSAAGSVSASNGRRDLLAPQADVDTLKL